MELNNTIDLISQINRIISDQRKTNSLANIKKIIKLKTDTFSFLNQTQTEIFRNELKRLIDKYKQKRPKPAFFKYKMFDSKNGRTQRVGKVYTNTEQIDKIARTSKGIIFNPEIQSLLDNYHKLSTRLISTEEVLGEYKQSGGAHADLYPGTSEGSIWHIIELLMTGVALPAHAVEEYRKHWVGSEGGYIPWWEAEAATGGYAVGPYTNILGRV